MRWVHVPNTVIYVSITGTKSWIWKEGNYGPWKKAEGFSLDQLDQSDESEHVGTEILLW